MANKYSKRFPTFLVVVVREIYIKIKFKFKYLNLNQSLYLT